MSTEIEYTRPPKAILVTSSAGAAFSIALTSISIGFFLVLIAMMSMAFLTMLVARALAPPATPGLIMSSIRRSTMLMVDLRNRPCSWRPLVWGRRMGLVDM